MDSTDLVIVFFIVIIFSLVLGFAYLQGKARTERLSRQAEKRGGKIRKDGFWKQSELLIPFKDALIVIRTIPGSKYTPPKTIAQVKLDSPRLPAIRITRNDLGQKMLAAFGRERQLTNDEEFDRRWVVQADDLFTVNKLVTPEFKAQLEERILRSLVVDIRPQEISLTIAAIPSNDEGYDIFIETSLMILKKLL